MAEPISVAVYRGDMVESVHTVHAVALRDGVVVETAGDPNLVTFMRSSAKPLQAGPVSRLRDDLDARDLAIASASHLADDDQLAAVRALLAKAGATEDDLECGTFDGSRLKHNCSGKHAAMLALCHERGWTFEGYHLAEHPCQQAMLGEIARRLKRSPATAVDGCGVVTFALALVEAAAVFGTVDAPVADAMRAYPDLIRGPGGVDTELMRTHDDWIAKGGAEGLICAAGDGLCVALKVEDGNARALRPALATFLERLGVDPSPFGPTEVTNSRAEVVGRIETAATT